MASAFTPSADESAMNGNEPVSSHTLKSKGGLYRLFRALGYSRRGILAAIRHEASFRQELIATAVLVPLALWLPFSVVERVLLMGSVLLVLIVELLNSSIEAVVDRISPDMHPLAGRAKDLGSAAVLVALCLMVFAWVVIGGPVLLERFGG
jgi:diacylglycerol kinase (ATP)